MPHNAAHPIETVLVTGGCGFIGSHLCDALIRTGHRVRVIDDLSTGKVENMTPGVEFVRGCVADPTVLARALRGMTACYHLAAIASVDRSRRDPFQAHLVNQGSFVALLDQISRLPSGPIPLVYASSAAVYGDGSETPIDEMAPKQPVSSYGADKYGCELHAAAAQTTGISSVGLRFFNVYGPRQDPSSPYSGVISIFENRIRGGGSITIYGDGLQTRDFVAVEDVVAALQAAMRLASTQSGARVFNVCTGFPTSILQLSRAVAGLRGMPPTLTFEPARQGDIRHSVGSPFRARELLGLPEPTPLAVGLQRLLATEPRLPVRGVADAQPAS